jgi:hypothetical protein
LSYRQDDPEVLPKEALMRSLIAGLLAITILGGCVAVPYYAEPAPTGYYYYGPAYPPASIQFRYDYYHRGPRHRY